MAKRLQDLPQVVYVARVRPDSGEEYLTASAERDDLVDDGEGITYVGRYEMVEWQKLRRAVQEVK